MTTTSMPRPKKPLPTKAPSPVPSLPPLPTPPPSPPSSPRRGRAPSSVNVPTDSEPTTTAGRIAARRISLDLSQRDLANLLRPPSHQSVIGVIERGDREILPELLGKIAVALKCDPCDLDTSLIPANSVTLARVDDGTPGVSSPRWEPLRGVDRAVMGELWEGYGPVSGDLGSLVDRAAEDGVAVVLRGDLPVRTGED